MSTTHGLDGWLSASDVQAFHARLELLVQPPSTNALTALVGCTLSRLPFQNINMLARPRRSPTLSEVREDMLSGSGGPCGHMNSFLAALLHELGYEVHLVAGSMQALDCHIALLVLLNGERLWVDVGNGFPYLEPIALSDFQPRHHPLIEHRLRRIGDEHWQVEHRRPGQSQWARNYDFQATPRAFSSFTRMIEAHYSQPGYGPFLLGLRVNTHTPHRSVVLRDRVLRIVDGSCDDYSTLDDAGLAAALREHFPGTNLPLQEALASSHGASADAHH